MLDWYLVFKPEFYMSTFRFCICLLLPVLLLTSCAPGPTPSSPTPIPPKPTGTTPATTESEFSSFKVGTRYRDTSGDMAIPFLDVVAFEAAVNEETQLLEVAFHMRDI